MAKTMPPIGHMQPEGSTDVRVPKTYPAGRGARFENLAVRLRPGRIHHCMRSDRQGRTGAGNDGQARRDTPRLFGQKIAKLGKNLEVHLAARGSRSNACCCRAAGRQGDGRAGQQGSADHMSRMKPWCRRRSACFIEPSDADACAAGMSATGFPLARQYADQAPTLRYADGPTKCTNMVVARRRKCRRHGLW